MTHHAEAMTMSQQTLLLSAPVQESYTVTICFKTMLKVFLVVATVFAPCESLTTNSSSQPQQSRRSVLALPFIATATVPSIANALDMDAFMNQELSKDDCDSRTSKKCVQKLTDDEALCKYGQPSKERGDACARAGQSTKLSKSGVDAYGKVNRGDFTRCKQFYELDKNGEYVKKTECGLPPT